MISIHVQDDASPRLLRLSSRIKNGQGFLKTWGNAVAKDARQNAISKSRGGGFWRGVAESTRLRGLSSSSIEVRCDHYAGAFKHHGGRIFAVRAKELTIPISPISKGKRVAELKMMGYVFFRSKKSDILFGSRGKELAQPLYALRKSVMQKPDPWWPSERMIDRRGVRECIWWLRKEMQ